MMFRIFLLTLALGITTVCNAATPDWCVRILCYERVDGVMDYVVDSAGSGTLTRYGVLTNNHVIKDAERIEVVFPDQTVVDVKVKRKEVVRDLALLQGNFQGRKWIELATEVPELGSNITIHGYGQFNYLEQRGKIKKWYIQEDTNFQMFMEMLPCKARPGDSGGAITQNGRLVGVLFGSGPVKPASEWGKPNDGYTMGTKIDYIRPFVDAEPVNPYDILKKGLKAFGFQ